MKRIVLIPDLGEKVLLLGYRLVSLLELVETIGLDIFDLSRVAQKIEELLSLFDGPTLIIGNDYVNQGALLKNIIDKTVLLAPAHQWNLKASSVGFLGLKRFQARDFDDLQGLNPLYQRPPDIRPNPFFPHKPGIHEGL